MMISQYYIEDWWVTVRKLPFHRAKMLFSHRNALTQHAATHWLSCDHKAADEHIILPQRSCSRWHTTDHVWSEIYHRTNYNEETYIYRNSFVSKTCPLLSH